MKRVILLGASGSIGSQTIDILKAHKDELQLVGVSVGNNIDSLIEILNEFPCEYAYAIKENEQLISKFPDTRFFFGDNGLNELVQVQDYDLLVNALVGFVGFVPTLKAIYNHKDIALANKETLVAGGDIINKALSENNVNLYPIDSEHSAIMQSMQGHNYSDIKRLIITGSGGSFRDLSREELASKATLETALKHPSWSMGAKITIDSATMMNKGFEVIEAHHLFKIPYDKIDVILHRESVVHSMVEYNDGSIIGQLGCPDMRLPIKYALLYPNHLSDSYTNYLDLDTLTSLNFKKMDYERYPLVKLAKEIGKFSGNFGAILIGSNDEAVDLFLKERISFIDIEDYIFKALKAAHYIENPTVEQIISSYKWAKEFVDDLWANN